MPLSALLGPGIVRLLADLPSPEADPDDVRRAADDILSRPEYREPAETLWERVNRELGEAIGELLGAIGVGGGTVAPLVAWLVLAVLLGGVGALVWWAVSSGRWGEGRRSQAPGDPVILSTDAHRSSGDWLSDAERHEAEGRWSEGLLYRYRSLVVDLVERGIIPEQAGRTAGEYVRDVNAHHAAGAGPFAAASELFEAAWYGGAVTGPGERDRFVGLVDQVLRSRQTSQEIGADR